MKTFTTFIASLMLIVTSSVAVAADKSVNIYVSHKSGGGMATHQQVVADGLTSLGWDVNLTILGNCGAGKEKLVDDELNLIGYAASWLTNADHTCFTDVNNANFAGVIYSQYYYLCGPNGDLDFSFEQNKKYKMGVNKGSVDRPMLQELANKLNVEFAFIEYKNSGAIRQAFAAKEIDLTYSSNGPKFIKNNQAKCLYTSDPAPTADVTPLVDVVDNKLSKRNYMGIFLVNNKQNQNYTQLENDLETVKASDEYQQLLKTRGVTTVLGSNDSQFTALSETIESEK